VNLIDDWANADGPLYRRLGDGIRLAIARGDLAVGQVLPPERILARELAVSRSTVVASYEMLRDEGLLERRQGSGTRVRSRPATAVQAGVLNPALNRNTLFRSMANGTGNTIDLTGAYLLEPSELQASILRDSSKDLEPLAQTSGYSPLGYMPLRHAVAEHL